MMLIIMIKKGRGSRGLCFLMGILKGQSPLSNELVKKIIKKWKGF
jgi:hypothetical protein